MNWGKVALSALVGGIVVWLSDFVMHGIVLGDTYRKYPEVFVQESTGVGWFLLISISIALVVGALFAKTRSVWALGVSGGVAFGFWVGMVGFFPAFYWPLVLDGYPYYLAWCQGGVTVITSLILGAVLGLLNKG